MHLEHLIPNLDKLGLAYAAGKPSSIEQIAEVEERLDVRIPAQVRLFYQHFDGLTVENPPLQILPLAQLALTGPGMLHFSTFDKQHKVCFDISQLNEAGQWSIVFCDNQNRITCTMASFWSNKIWKWLQARHEVWLD